MHPQDQQDNIRGGGGFLWISPWMSYGFLAPVSDPAANSGIFILVNILTIPDFAYF